jgi:hypothetical protein
MSNLNELQNGDEVIIIYNDKTKLSTVIEKTDTGIFVDGYDSNFNISTGLSNTDGDGTRIESGGHAKLKKIELEIKKQNLINIIRSDESPLEKLNISELEEIVNLIGEFQ